MTRSAWKGPYVAVSLLKDVINFAQKHPDWWNKGRFTGVQAPDTIKTMSRSSTVLPDFINCKFGVHDGKTFQEVEVTKEMIGHRFGELALTRKIYCPYYDSRLLYFSVFTLALAAWFAVQLPVFKVKDKSGGKKINPRTGKSG